MALLMSIISISLPHFKSLRNSSMMSCLPENPDIHPDPLPRDSEMELSCDRRTERRRRTGRTEDREPDP